MEAEVVSIGTELLLGQITDTNAVEAAKVLAEAGVSCRRRTTVGDNLERLTGVLREAFSRVPLVLTIGGLGPTDDDVTREGIAAALDLPLEEDPALLERLREGVRARGVPWVDSLARQALRPPGSRVLPNPNGTAVGLVCEGGGRTAVALPGPRGEFVPMLRERVLPFLIERGGGERIVSRVLRVCGLGESVIEDRLRDLMRSESPTLAPLAKVGEVHLRITARGADAAARIGEVERRVREVLGDAVYGADEETLEAVVLEAFRSRSMTLATVESCTGGLLGGRLTSVPGSSDVYLGGFVTYSNAMKRDILGVPEAVLSEHGAVSRECAEAMATGCRRVTVADVAVAVTGIAGPSGGTDEKPVGTVWIAVAGPADARVERHLFRGGREIVRERSVRAALTLLRRSCL